MTKALSKLRILSFVLFMIEIAGMTTITLFYYFDWFGFRDTDYIVAYVCIAFTAITLADGLFYWFSLVHINKLRQKNDVEAARLVGSDVQ